MFLYLIATVRSTETWAAHHLIALGLVIALVVWVIHRFRVRRGG